MTTLSIEYLKAWLELLPKVTPGPYTYGSKYLCRYREGMYYERIAQALENEEDSPRWNTDAAHLAKCDPATISALIEGYIAMAEALRVYGEWSIDVSTLGEFSDLEKRMNAAGITFTQLGEWASPKKPLAPALNIGGTND